MNEIMAVVAPMYSTNTLASSKSTLKWFGRKLKNLTADVDEPSHVSRFRNKLIETCEEESVSFGAAFLKVGLHEEVSLLASIDLR